MSIKISIVFGTRPEVIKLARVIKAFEKERNVVLNICFTGQHKEMVLPLLDFFEVRIDYSLEIMVPNQSLAGLSARSLTLIDDYLIRAEPKVVIVQGDTSTAMCAAISAFYRKIKIAHVEAGLRTHNIFSPFPEEFNRGVISKIANLHFAPTITEKENLLKENVEHSLIYVTGNTVIDSLLYTKSKLTSGVDHFKKSPWKENNNKIILITGHRRENFGFGLENICNAIKELAIKYANFNFVFPVHLNPSVQEPVNRILRGLNNVYLVPPMEYIEFISAMESCYFIMTDSGGIQEEAPSLGKPVLVMRDSTERCEAIKAGAAKLVGTNKDVIIQNVIELIENTKLFEKMSNVNNPFGEGNASTMIVDHIMAYL